MSSSPLDTPKKARGKAGAAVMKASRAVKGATPDKRGVLQDVIVAKQPAGKIAWLEAKTTDRGGGAVGTRGPAKGAVVADRGAAGGSMFEGPVTIRGATGKGSFSRLYRSEPLERVRMIKAGVPALDAKRLLGTLAIPSLVLHEALDLSVSTLNRRAKDAKALTTDEGERVLGLARLIGQVEAMVEESGEPEGFDAGIWTTQWLTEPVPALGGVRPIDLLDTMEGQTLVSDTLARIQSGAYA